MHTSAHLDWVAATYPCGYSLQDTLPREFIQAPFANKGTGAHGYRTRLTNAQGISVMLNGTDAQGVHLTLPGSALAALRDIGLTDRALCQHVVDNGGRLARLDVAVNIHDGQLTPQDIHDAYIEGRAKTRAKSGLRHLRLLKPGDTLALGNRQSERYFRAYDKRAETHTEGKPWLRLELECKKRHAQSLADALASQDNTRAVINRAVKSYLDLPGMEEYQAALSDSSATIPEVPRKLTNTMAWLIEQVAPAMVNYEREHANVDTLAILTAVLEELRSASVVAAADDGTYRAVGTSNS